MPNRTPVDSSEVIKKLLAKAALPVPVAPIPAASVPVLQQQRILSDHDVIMLAAQAPITNPGINLAGANLAAAQLPRIALYRPYLDGSLLPQAMLDGASIAGCYPNLSLHPVTKVAASLASLQGAGFSDLYVEACAFDHAVFNGAQMLSSNIWSCCNFDWSAWVGTVFHGSIQPGSVSFTDSTFRSAVFKNWVVALDDPARPLIFNRCDFTGAQFINCSLQGVQFKQCIMP